MFSLFRSLMPREESFFEHFTAHSQLIVKAADALNTMIGGGGDIAANLQVIREAEGQADDIARQIHVAVHRTFITPFDRSDIQKLIKRLDDTIDLIEDAAQHVVEAGLGHDDFMEEMKQQSASILRGAKLLAEAMPLLEVINRNAPKLAEISTTMGDIESAADAVLRQAKLAMRDNSGGINAPLTYRTLHQRELLEQLESVVDRCLDVCDIVDGIVVEHV